MSVRDRRGGGLHALQHAHVRSPRIPDEFRLAAVWKDRIFLYQAWRTPRAKVGADLFDLAGNVRAIDVQRGEPMELRHKGPHLPIILEACQEAQLSYEYRDGATSYGAFTFSLAKVLRESRTQERNPNFNSLVASTANRLEILGYDQTPSLVGPKRLLRRPARALGEAADAQQESGEPGLGQGHDVLHARDVATVSSASSKGSGHSP